jgi:hypothetical protein
VTGLVISRSWLLAQAVLDSAGDVLCVPYFPAD